MKLYLITLFFLFSAGLNGQMEYHKTELRFGGDNSPASFFTELYSTKGKSRSVTSSPGFPSELVVIIDSLAGRVLKLSVAFGTFGYEEMSLEEFTAERDYFSNDTNQEPESEMYFEGKDFRLRKGTKQWLGMTLVKYKGKRSENGWLAIADKPGFRSNHILKDGRRAMLAEAYFGRGKTKAALILKDYKYSESVEDSLFSMIPPENYVPQDDVFSNMKVYEDHSEEEPEPIITTRKYVSTSKPLPDTVKAEVWKFFTSRIEKGYTIEPEVEEIQVIPGRIRHIYSMNGEPQNIYLEDSLESWSMNLSFNNNIYSFDTVTPEFSSYSVKLDSGVLITEGTQNFKNISGIRISGRDTLLHVKLYSWQGMEAKGEGWLLMRMLAGRQRSDLYQLADGRKGMLVEYSLQTTGFEAAEVLDNGKLNKSRNRERMTAPEIITGSFTGPDTLLLPGRLFEMIPPEGYEER